MDLRQLRVFVEIVRLGNFTRAAEKLHIAQPAVSMTIRKLEDEFDLVLLNRQERKVVPTAEGEALFHHAERLLEMAQLAEQEMSDIRELIQGEVRVGIPPMMSAYYFPGIIEGFLERYPKLRLQISGEGAGRIQQMIIDGDIDMGVIAQPDRSEGLSYQHLIKAEIVTCFACDHHFASQDSVEIQEFLKEPLILFKEGYYTRELIKELLLEEKIEPNIVFETNLYTLVRNMIKMRLGVSTFLRMAVVEDREIAFKSFSTPLYIDLYIAWKSQRYVSRANRAFIDFLREQTVT